MPQPTSATEKDAWDVTFFPWAGASRSLLEYIGEGKARVMNSIALDAPPFFGFDIHPGEQWYHVIGADHWAVVNGRRISPALNTARQLRDSETLWVHGHVDGEFLLASYVGFGDGVPYYYRSLLRSDELRQNLLPEAYNGLAVWVRGWLDVGQGQGEFYSLPEGTWIDGDYLNQEALVAGTLSIDGQTTVRVASGIFMRSGNQYVNVLEGQVPASAEDMYVTGVIRSFGSPGQWFVVESDDSSSVEVDIEESTSIEFADGSEASLGDLFSGQRVEVAGQSVSRQRIAATKVTIVSLSTTGATYAAYGKANGELWSIDLESLESGRIAQPAPASHGLTGAQFSPDGRRFAFAQTQDGLSTLVVGDLRTGVLRAWLAGDEWQEAGPVWSPDGSRIAFCRYRSDEEQTVDGGLWIAKLQDGSTRRVSAPASAGWRTVQPQWSPNGKHIAFGHSGESKSQATKVFVLSFPPQVQWVLDWVWDWRWSMDSSHLLTTRQTSEEAWARLWVVQRDGTSPTWLSVKNVHDYHGRWSPDGTAIAFLARRGTSSGPDALWIMQADGMRRFQPSQLPLASDLTWSPDSQSVILLRVSEGGQNDGLWIVGRDGSGLRQLVPEATALVGVYREP